LDARIAAAFADDAKSDDVRRVLADVEAAANVAEAAAQDARARALDPLVADVIVARRAMDDAAFKRDRLIEAAKRLAKRVDELKALEKARRQGAEHKRVCDERERLAAELKCMVEPILQIAQLVAEAGACDRWARQVNAASAQALGYVRPVLADVPPAIATLFSDVAVFDAFVEVARVHPLPKMNKTAASRP
jgi:hypothetical protein